MNAYSSESNWVWASGTGGTWKDTTKTGTSYMNFISGQPTSTPDCARMRNNASGTWEGYDCSSSHDYICEGPAGR